MILDNVLWVEKYRPDTLEDCILPESVKKQFQGFIDSGYLPNLLLTGSSGVGKTTLAKAAINDLKSSCMVINASLKGGIDTLRFEISQYASSVSLLGGGRKYVILDEADYLTRSTQPALRNFMEEYSANCGFILTCNYPNRILKEVKSRLAVIDFSFKGLTQEEETELRKQQLKRIFHILDSEKVQYDKRVVLEFFKFYEPDLRKTINELQRYSKNGAIDAGILAAFSKKDMTSLVESLKKRDFTNVRRWVAENADVDFSVFVSDLYEELVDEVDKKKIPYLVMDLNKYDYQNAFVSNVELNMTAMLTEIMSDCF